MSSDAIKLKYGLFYQSFSKPSLVFSNKRDAIESFGFIEGDIIRVGYPNIHSVFKMNKDGNLIFQYHYDKQKLESK